MILDSAFANRFARFVTGSSTFIKIDSAKLHRYSQAI